MASFLWHHVSENEEIRKEAKRIMDNFSKKLDKIRHRSVYTKEMRVPLRGPKALNVGGKSEETFIERENCEREENNKGSLDLDREIMFENAPHKNKDFIVAEKKGWGE